MFGEFGHKTLAEAHNFRVGLALGIKVGAAFGAADGKAREGVFEDLLKAEELDDAFVDRRMEAQTALVGADGAVELDAVAAVDLHLARVVHPRHAELDDAFGLDDAGDHALVDEFGVFGHDRFERFQHFGDGLVELFFTGVALFDLFQQVGEIGVLDHDFSPFDMEKSIITQVIIYGIILSQ